MTYVKNTVQKTYQKSVLKNDEIMGISEIGFHCIKNIRFMNTKNIKYESCDLCPCFERNF